MQHCASSALRTVPFSMCLKDILPEYGIVPSTQLAPVLPVPLVTEVRIWSVENGSCISVLEGNGGDVYSVRWKPGSNVGISGPVAIVAQVETLTLVAAYSDCFIRQDPPNMGR